MTTQQHSDFFIHMERNQRARILVNTERVLGKTPTTEFVLENICGKDTKKQLVYINDRIRHLGGPLMRRAQFTLGDDLDTIYEGWTYGDLWNGFSNPYLTRDGVERLRLNNANYPGELDQFSWKDGDVLVVTPMTEDPPYEVEPDLAPDGSQVWDCAFGFTWMEAGL